MKLEDLKKGMPIRIVNGPRQGQRGTILKVLDKGTTSCRATVKIGNDRFTIANGWLKLDTKSNLRR